MPGMAAYAVVDESVKVAAKLVRPQAKGMVNAVLRKIAALSAELEAESGHPVMALSGASGAGVPAVLDKLLEAIGHPEPGEDESEESTDWSPI